MGEGDTKHLQEELEQVHREKEQIRALLGQIGGARSAKRDTLINIAFVVAVLALLLLDVLRHLLKLSVPLPAMFSLELGVLLVSIKIIWMIHRQSKVEHFQFWILSSIEFRLNDLAKQTREMDRILRGERSAEPTRGSGT